MKSFYVVMDCYIQFMLWRENIIQAAQQPGFDSNIYIENLNSESPIAQEILTEYKSPPEGFDKVGFTRPLGGFFYEFFYAIVVGIAVALTFSLILKALYPYPDSKAYTSVGNVLFSFLFFVMNIPTAFSIEIFVAQYRVHNPAKMIQYIRFYVWYQMLTGILLVTFTSIYVLYIMKTGNLMYTKFLLLILISREYPAMTNVFGATLKGLQRFDLQTKLNYFAQIIEPLCEVVCVLIGRYWLGSNPVFGELMGIAIGYAVGTYVDDFITMILSMVYLNRVLKPLGYNVIDTIIPHVEKDVWKESLIFGLKLSPPGFLSSILGFFSFFWWYQMVPAYATFLVLNQTADSIANIVRRGGGIYLKGTISESLSNNKKELTHYYMAFALKFSFMTMFAIATILFTFMPLIVEVLFITGGLENWVLVAAFITPNVLSSTSEQVHNIGNDVILGGKNAGFYAAVNVFQTISQFGWDFLLLFILKWPQNATITVLIWIIALKDFPNKIIVVLINYTFIHKKLFKIKFKDFVWQTLIAPLPATGAVWIFSEFWFHIVYPALYSLGGPYLAAGISLVAGVLCLLWIFFPVYCAFGGWDNYGLKVFTDAVEISGPSKFLFRPIVWANKLMVKSPLHNKFPIPFDAANRQAEELMKERFIKEKINEVLLSMEKSQVIE